jgi:hypothetical protein
MVAWQLKEQSINWQACKAVTYAQLLQQAGIPAVVQQFQLEAPPAAARGNG